MTAKPGAVAPTTTETTAGGRAPPMIESPGGKLGPLDHSADLMAPLLVAMALASPISALIYGFVFSGRPPSPFRTAIKTLPVGILAFLALVGVVVDWAQMDPPIRIAWLVLTAGFALCAVGDAFLAGDPKRWLPPGLVAFLLGHLCFIGLFAMAGATQAVGPAVIAAMVATAVVGAGMLRWLWPSLGPMRWPVTAYVAVIVVMVCAGLTHWSHNIAWAIGGLLFMASDAILAAQLFKGAKLPGPERLTHWAIWFLYYAAQLAFLAGMIGYVVKADS